MSANESSTSSFRDQLLTKPAWALRRSLRAGYRAADFRADVMAGIVVGIVALPLSMALAIASGVPPQHGLYTAIVAGAAVAALGGSRLQITGPTAAFVVILAPIAEQYGLGGLSVATLFAGLVLVTMGVFGLGKLIQFIPYPVTTGFTAGIAIVIASLQWRDFLGLHMAEPSTHALERLAQSAAAWRTIEPAQLGIGLFTFAVLKIWPRFVRSVPAPLVALGLAGVVAAIVNHYWPGLAIPTINSRFTFDVGGVSGVGIPRTPPLPMLPWMLPGGDGAPLTLDLAMLRTLFLSGVAIALLGAIESLLSAVVADGMTHDSHDPDAEILALGIGNIVAPFFGGIAATGAIARTATNIRSGGRSPISGIIHALFVLAAMITLAPLLGYLPMPALAALLMLVAWNMSDARHAVHIVRTAPKSDAFVLVTCMLLTVVFDMVVAVTAGVVLASLLFMGRMAEVTGSNLIHEPDHAEGVPLPPKTLIYEIAGPLFFGAAEKATSALADIGRAGTTIRAVILDIRSVPAMDATGMVALESARDRLREAGVFVVLAGLREQPRRVLTKAGWTGQTDQALLCDTLAEAAQAVRDYFEAHRIDAD